MNTQPNSVCILRLSAIGDCCHTLPLIRTIQHAWPATEITWIIGKTERQLIDGLDGVRLVTYDKSRGHAAAFDVRRELRGRRFPILLNIHASMRANIASLGIRARRRIGFDKARARDSQWLLTNERVPAAREHVIDGFLGFATYLGIHEHKKRWDIPLPDGAREIAAKLSDNRPLCVISPCSSQRARNFRNWSVRSYVAVAEAISSKYDAQVVLTGSPTSLERSYASAIEEAASCAITNLVGKTNLKELLAILEAADLLICPDSGPAHMATAVGTPVIGLYATSNPDRTGPYLSKHLVVNKYPTAIANEFGKPIEDLRWGVRVRDPDAMSLISVDDVLQKAAVVLAP